MDQEKDFYNELDKSHRKKRNKTMSAWSLTIFFIVLIAITEGVIFYLGSSLRVKPDEELTRSANIQGELNLVSSHEINANSPIYIPEGLLCSQLGLTLKQEIKCSISEDNIQISGKLSGLLPANASAFFAPNNAEDSAKLELKDIKIGKISTFRFLGAPLNSVINKALKASITNEDFRVKRIDLESGLMVVLVNK